MNRGIKLLIRVPVTASGFSASSALDLCQIDDATLYHFTRDEGWETLNSSNQVGGAECGHFGNHLCQLTHRHAPAGLDGGLELFRRIGIDGVVVLHNLEFDGHRNPVCCSSGKDLSLLSNPTEVQADAAICVSTAR